MATQQSKTRIPQGATSFYDFSQNDNGGQPGATPTQNDGGNGTPAPPTQNGNNGYTSSTRTTTTTSTSPYAQFKGSNLKELEEFIREQMDANKPETKEEREKRERREKWEGVINGIGDMGMALSNLFFTTKYAPNMYDGKDSLTAKAKERFEKAKAERERKRERFMNYALMLDKLNSSKAQSEYQQKSLDIKQQQQDRLDKQEETNRNIAEAKVKYYEAQSNKNDEQAAYWKTKAELLERGWPQEQAEQAARIEERKAKAAKYSHDANAPYKSSSGGRTGGGGTLREGTVKVTEKTDARGRKTTTRTYVQPRRQGGISRSSGSSSRGKSYTNTKKLGL